MTEPTWATLSGVPLVDDLTVAEMDGHTELHVDCLAQGLCGDLLPIAIYYSFTDAAEISRMKALLQPGVLLRVHNEALVVVGNSFRMMGPELKPFTGDANALRHDLERQRRTSELRGSR